MPKKPLIQLDTSVRYVKGVGPKMAARLRKLDINTVKDLIEHYPFRYEDYTKQSLIKNLKPGQKATINGKITKIKSTFTRSPRYKTIQKAVLKDKSGKISLIWFNQPYLKNNFKPSIFVSVSGEISKRGNELQIIFPNYEIIKGEKNNKNTGRLVPIYPTTAGVSDNYLRKIIYQLIPKIENQIKNNLSEELRNQYNLISKQKAIIKIHLPENQKDINQAKKRLGFEELFRIHLKNLEKKRQWKKNRPAPKLNKNINLIKRFTRLLPFNLTSAQKRAIKEILDDINQKNSMNRLLQGDVGSGKTVVAASAIIQTAENNYQSILMAPTEILAQQHFKTLSKMLKPFGVNCQLLTSSHKPSNTSTKDLIIGTHALIHKHAQFKQPGLVIIDEQHRFGVSQRGKLVQKAQIDNKNRRFPHVLTMTATPIPRTIALTLYGNLDISTLDELPPGRKPIKTSLVPKNKRQDCYQWVREQAQKNYQGFVVCPLIEESESLSSVKAATNEYKELSQKVFPDLRLSLLHGKIKSEEKEKILNQMHRGEVDILVSTPVVEVGIDIPNAKFMIIEAANRFGLAQLHQLRGRVGRGENQAYCFLFAEKISPKARKRILAMENINDGLKLAKIDLKIRGPGEIYGTKQHGYPELKVADYNNLELIKKTRQAAKQVHLRGVSL